LQWKEKQKADNKGKTSSHAAASAAIKAELNKAFPEIKFSVRSDSFAGGNSVHISWNDGPNSDEVNALTKKYQYGSFDGMTDMYEYTNNREDIPQAKYVQAQRSMSEEARAALTPEAERIYEENKEFFQDGRVWDASQFLNQIYYPHSYPAGAIFTGIGANDGDRSGVSGMYKPTYTAPEAKQAAPQAQKQPQIKGKIQIVDYSEKSVAVIGETYAIRASLKEMGGRFNKFLSCGAGWIFPKSQLEELKAALTKPKEEAKPEQTTLKDEIQETINFFASHDLETVGEITEGTREAARVQNVDIPEQYTDLATMTAAAKEGKVISLYNMSQLVNRRAHV